MEIIWPRAGATSRWTWRSAAPALTPAPARGLLVGLTHFDLLNHPDVYEEMRRWIAAAVRT